ncbi:cytochrome P450 [Aspergillus pseudotamarii]|uniref:Cytochrome P450 n=1 Tax=Aspergillus pseudotamarii TaxID=132259 RepID=A0A5N6TBH4_ASPPS|nr:cytochrome P450 [Aspergillus pseudotamarii]KAE8143617.1 cytochrome P450 [Aspergillus pseudotamarii]
MPFCTWTAVGSAIGSLIAIALISQIYTFQVATKISRRNGLPRISSRDVFGIGLLGTIAQQMKIDRVFEWASDMLNVPGRTVDMTLFRLRFIWTDAPENTHALLSSQFSDYGKGDFVHKLLGNLGEGLLVTVDGAEWRAKRKELRPHLSTLSENDREITELHLRPLLERLSQSQTPIDIFDVIDKLQLDIAIHRFVGQLTDADEAGYQRFRKAKRTLAAAGTIRPFIGPLGFLVKPIERTARRDLDIYVQKLLRAADHSIFAKSEAEIEHRRELLLNLILAGKDPTVITITWAIYELSRNPDVLKKLRLEIADMFAIPPPITLYCFTP